MIGGKAHAYLVIDISRQIVTNINIIKTAEIDAINARVASPDVMRINLAFLAEIRFGNRRIPLIEGKPSLYVVLTPVSCSITLN